MCSTPGAAAAAAAELPPADVALGRESWAMQFSRSKSHMYTLSAQWWGSKERKGVGRKVQWSGGSQQARDCLCRPRSHHQPTTCQGPGGGLISCP